MRTTPAASRGRRDGAIIADLHRRGESVHAVARPTTGMVSRRAGCSLSCLRWEAMLR